MHDLSKSWLKKGEVPCYDCYGDVSSIYGRMKMLNLVSQADAPKLKGLKTDPMDVIIGHMKVTFETVARPVLYKAVNDESCYACFQKAKGILIKVARAFIGEERAEMTTKHYNLFEIIILGGMGKFQEARQALEMDKQFHPIYAKNLLSCGFLDDVENNDREGFRRTITEIRAKNIEMLKKSGLIKSSEMI